MVTTLKKIISSVKYGLSDVAIIGHAPVDSMQTDTFIYVQSNSPTRQHLPPVTCCSGV